MKKLTIFRPGTFTPMNGKAIDFSKSDIATIIAGYNRDKGEAPIVVGHPTLNAPAFGWIDKLQMGDDGAIEAIPHQVDAAFAALVSEGKYKKISSSFFAPNDTGNPNPGNYYLRHVGFLGAMPPAVPGLRGIEFSQSEGDINFSADFVDYDDLRVVRILRGLREWIIGKFGAEEANKIVDNWDLDSLTQSAMTEPPAPSETSFSTTQPQEVIVTKEEADKLAAENAALKQQIAFAATRAKADALHSQNVAFADGLVTGGKIVADHKAVIVATLDALGAGEKPISFAAGDGVEKPLADEFKAMFAAAKPIINFAEFATGGKAADKSSTSDKRFAGMNVDEERAALHDKAIAFAAANKTDYATAITAVTNQGVN
ncbi:MAG: peptidase [Alphaproteobacteria bacterium]|nr:peptidase [Alphaproteobacteria bacterium]